MLLSCGDALIDFLPVKSVDGRDAIVPAVGGSCLNIAVGMARLGAAAGFVGGISTDLFGGMIADYASASQVDLRYATRSELQTTLAFVRFDRIEAVHVGSTTLANDKGAAEALAMLEDADGSTTVSFDPNCRPKLVKDRARYIERMDAFAATADIVRMSDVDFEFLYGGSDYSGRAHSLIEAGAGLVVVTRGIKGALAWHREAGSVEVEAPGVDVVDTIGAGDSFQAALLFALRAMGRIEIKALAHMNSDELRRVLTFAAACAAITCGRAGADPPRRAEIGAELSRLLQA
jgi:fructokinase